MKSKLTDQQRVDIVHEYKNSNIKCVELARRYNISRPSICYLLKTRGVKIRNDHSVLQRKHSLNQEYFKKIDSEDKAYFLGLMYADGYNDEKNHRLVISLQERDGDILETFRAKIEYGGKLGFIPANNKTYMRQNQYSLSIRSHEISKDLKNLGCWQKKSLTLKFPTEKQVPSHLVHHFLRGYWDGDGCIEKGCFRTEIVSTKDFCSSVRSLIDTILDIQTISKRANKYSKNEITYRLRSRNKLDTIKILDWLYKDASIFLKRKHNIYLKVDRELCENRYY